MIQIFHILPLQQNSVNMQAIPIIDTCALSSIAVAIQSSK